MADDTTINRRTALATFAATAGAAVAAGATGQTAHAQEGPLKGNLKQSVCKWCYRDLSLDELCTAAKIIGLKSVELLDPEEWDTVKGHGLTCAMANGPGPIHKGWNRIEQHDELVAKAEELLPKVAEAGLPNMIVFSGNRDGLDDMEGIKNCAQGLKRITPLAEKLGVTVCMELLNSKVNHKDYQCDHTEWGGSLVDAVGSERFKLLYDIYHMQIMEGDVIATIEKHFDAIGHYHTGGVPGRNEIDETQELYYPRICQAIVELGFTGYLAQEFIPLRDNDPIESLTKAARLCDV